MMRVILAFCVAVAAGSAAAQDPVATDSDKYVVLLENEHVRVLEYRDQPGDRTEQHGHPANVVYALGTFERKITSTDGTEMRAEVKAGDVLWFDAETHVGENVGETPTHVILVEMKQLP